MFVLTVSDYSLDRYTDLLIAACKSSNVLEVSPRYRFISVTYPSKQSAQAGALDIETTAYCKTEVKEVRG